VLLQSNTSRLITRVMSDLMSHEHKQSLCGRAASRTTSAILINAV
jgi:hypothetical protein